MSVTETLSVPYLAQTDRGLRELRTQQGAAEIKERAAEFANRQVVSYAAERVREVQLPWWGALYR